MRTGRLSLQMLAVLAFLLGAGLAIPVRAAAQDAEAFRPDTLLTLSEGTEVAHFRAGASEVVTIRVSVPLREAREEAGVGQVLRIQAEERMRNIAGRVGARAEARRTPSALVYQVAGAVQDLDFLVWILREGMSAPEPSRYEAARQEAVVDLERRLETPEGTIALRLREQLAPGEAPLAGRVSALERLESGHAAAAWARSHRSGAARVVTAGRVDPLLLAASLADLGLPEAGPDPRVPALQATGDPRGSPEVFRHWVTHGYGVDEADEARALVAARLLSGLLTESPGDYEASVALWELESGRALVVSGAAFPRGRTAMRARLDGLMTEGLAGLDDEVVRMLVSEIRTEILFAARGPWELAELVGRAWDAHGDPTEARNLLVELSRMETADVRRFLESLSGANPVVEEL